MSTTPNKKGTHPNVRPSMFESCAKRLEHVAKRELHLAWLGERGAQLAKR